MSRMAERFGMTEADLQKEIATGKTMQQIAQEHGVQFGRGMQNPNGTTIPAANTGTLTHSGSTTMTESGSLPTQQ